jgi:hypothetical protein
MLTPDERRLIFRYCWNHLVASCEPCQTHYRIDQLGIDSFRGLSHLCTKCRADLKASVRKHIASCTALRVQEAEAQEREKRNRQRRRLMIPAGPS